MTETSTQARPRPSALDILKRYLAPLLLVLASIGVVAVHVPQHTSISPIDEYVYIDYLYKVPTQFFVPRGDEVGDEARHYLDCKGVLYSDYANADRCAAGDESDDARFPMSGFTSADIYTPAYFAVTWVLAQPLVLFGMDLVDAGRYVGAVWLAAAAVMLYLALRRLKVPTTVSLGLGLLMLGTPAAFWANTYISTDAPAYTAGAALLLAVTHYRGRRIGWLLIGLGVLATLLKVQNFAAVGVVGLTLIALAVQRASGAEGLGHRLKGALRDRFTLTGLGMLAIPLVAQAAWIGIRAVTTLGTAGAQDAAVPFTPIVMVDEVFKFLGTGGYGPAVSGTAMSIGALLSQWVMLAGVIGAVALAARKSLVEAISGSTIVMSLLLGPALVVFTYVLAGIYVPLPQRYGMSLVPMMLVGSGWLFSKKPVLGWIMLGVGVVGYAAGLAIRVD